MRGPLLGTDGGVLLLVRATPKSSRDMISGLAVRAEEARLAVKVRAAPQDGDANDAVMQLIARSIGIARSSVSIAAGAKDRNKTVLLSGVGLDTVSEWLNGLNRHGETD